MIGIDCDGFDLRAEGVLRRCDFDGEVKDAQAARARYHSHTERKSTVPKLPECEPEPAGVPQKNAIVACRKKLSFSVFIKCCAGSGVRGVV